MPREQGVAIAFGGGEIPGALVLPDAVGAPAAGVVVLHELLGLNDDMRRIARRFASAGYAALAPDYFHGLGPKPICILRTFAALRAGGGRVLSAIEAARDFLAAREEVDAARVGVAGFCMGGGFALLLGREPRVAAAAVFYGEVPETAQELAGVCPVVAGYGGRDRLFGAQGHRLADHLKALGVPHDVRTYPEAGHSFMSEYRGVTRLLAPLPPLHAGHVESAAEDSWSRVLAFFAEHLGPDAAPPSA